VPWGDPGREGEPARGETQRTRETQSLNWVRNPLHLWRILPRWWSESRRGTEIAGERAALRDVLWEDGRVGEDERVGEDGRVGEDERVGVWGGGGDGAGGLG